MATCPECHGEGQVLLLQYFSKCRECNGKGILPDPVPAHVPTASGSSGSLTNTKTITTILETVTWNASTTTTTATGNIFYTGGLSHGTAGAVTITSTPVTVDSLRERLGLRTPRDQMLFVKREMAKLPNNEAKRYYEGLTRRSGKTTETILQGLVHVANGGEKVLFVAPNYRTANLITDRARAYAVRLGLDPKRITAVEDSPTAGRGLSSSQVFKDHSVGDDGV
jgi:hypothetical protein